MNLPAQILTTTLHLTDLCYHAKTLKTADEVEACLSSIGLAQQNLAQIQAELKCLHIRLMGDEIGVRL